MNILKKYLILLLGVVSVNSQALPLLSESAALNVANHLTLYPDHRDPHKFYFFPNSSEVVFDNAGLPLFSFTYWGLDQKERDAGAYMVFTSKLKVDQQQQKALEAFLKKNPKSGVAVLPVKKSLITLQSTTGQPPLKTLFEEFNFAPHAGRAEDEAAVSAVLTKVGARVFRATLTKSPGAAAAVQYCYKVEGLGPDLDARITVKMDRVYDYFKGNVSTKGFLWFKASITREVEKLRQKNYVKWEVNGGNASDEEYVKKVTEQVIKRMFKPELRANPIAMPEGSNWGFSWFRFRAGSVHREELKEEVWDIKRRDLVEREYCMPFVLRDLERFKDRIVINADTYGEDVL